VNVDVAAPNVDVAAPNVRVEPQITVELPAESGGGKRVAFQRDHKGFITGATVEEQ
jgi:hypothetical protein